MITGPAGAGKSVFLTQYLVSAARRGEAAAAYVFDESRASFLARAAGAGMDLGPHIAAGRVHLQQIDPAEMAPGEFAQMVCEDAKQRGVRVIGVDSLNGYLCSVPEEHFLPLHLHELLSALGQLGAVTVLTLSLSGISGQAARADIDVSYLCDAMIALRLFEAVGEMRKCVSVPKLRSGQHELTIREYRIGSDGLHVGEPVREFQGVLTGTPTYVGEGEPPAPRKSETHRAA
jgi:circadian clock protein KaiC